MTALRRLLIDDAIHVLHELTCSYCQRIAIMPFGYVMIFAVFAMVRVRLPMICTNMYRCLNAERQKQPLKLIDQLLAD